MLYIIFQYVCLSTGSNPEDIKRFGSHTGNTIFIPFCLFPIARFLFAILYESKCIKKSKDFSGGRNTARKLSGSV